MGYADIEAQLEQEYENRNAKKHTSHQFQTTLFPEEQYSLAVKPAGKDYQYILLQENIIVDTHTINKPPSKCNKDTKFISRFIKELEGNVKTPGSRLSYTREQISTIFMQQLRQLQSQLDDYSEHRDEIQKREKMESDSKRLQELTENYNELNRMLKENDATIIDYIQLCITYLINGENKNTLIGLLCHLSTYLKRGALWFMAVGKSGEGKSTIEHASIKLLPENAWMNGNMSEAALYRKTLNEGTDFLDGNIMRLGDLGGKSDFDKHEQILNLYKELSTDGSVELELTSDTIDDSIGERGTAKFMVKGYCSVSFATVHSENIEDQYANRGRIIEPEATNDQVRKFRLYNKGKYEDYVDFIIEKFINNFLHDYIEYIRLKHGDVKVFNPYLTCLHDWLNEDEYYKRSTGQYEKLVETVTLLNYPNRELVTNDEGEEYVVSTSEDNKLIADLFLPSFGISPTAIRLFNKLLEWFFNKRILTEDGGYVKKSCNVEEYMESVNSELADYKNVTGFGTNDFLSVFTVSEVKRKTSKTKSLHGIDVSSILNNLLQRGYIVSTDEKVKRSNKNIYRLNFFDPIENKGINFQESCIQEYVDHVVPVVYGLRYTPRDTCCEMKNIHDAEKLRECSICELEASKWF